MWHKMTSTHASTIAASCSVATSSSESLPNDVKKPNQPMRLLFPKYNRGCDYRGTEGFYEACIKFSTQHAEVVFINLYWKDGRFGITDGFCKHKSSSLHNQAVELICQEAGVTLPDIRT